MTVTTDITRSALDRFRDRLAGSNNPDHEQALSLLDEFIADYQPTWHDKIYVKQATAAIDAVQAEGDRNRRLDELARITAWPGRRIASVISLSPADEDDAEGGVFVILVAKRDEDESLWTTVVRGHSDNNYFTDRALAILHALAQDTAAQQHGAKSDHGTAAAFAARVLAIAVD